MARRLARHVHIYDDSGDPHQFAPGDMPPDWAAEKIVNPQAWEDDENPGPSEPPRAGRGSSRDAWSAHASGLGLTVTDDMSRDDIISLVDG